MQIKVAIVDDDEVIRSSLSTLLKRAPGYKLVGEYANGEIALKEIPLVQPDVVLMDINLPGMKGYDCVRALKDARPAIQFLMLTVYEDGDSLFNSLRAGASGYLLKRSSSAKLLGSIQEVYTGGAPMTPEIARRVVQYFGHLAKPVEEVQEMPSLTPRERDILEQLARGFRYKEIVDNLGISVGTLHSYISKVYEKLQVHSRTEAVVRYLNQ